MQIPFQSQLIIILPLISFSPISFTANPTDVVGRELLIPGLGWAGHTAIVTDDKVWNAGTYVVEALNEPQVLQINTIESFKKRSRFWGTKYGINQNDVTGTRIINEGAFQTSLKCAVYTYLPSYKPGTGQWGLPMTCPVFRCDTFVNYLYWWGGYKLPTYNPPGDDIYNSTLPSLVFNAFPYYRKETVSSSFIIPRVPFIHNITNEEIQEMDFKDLLNLISGNNFSQLNLENLFELVQNKAISKDKRILLLDKIGFISKPNTLPRLIALYYDVKDDVEISDMVLRDTQIIYQENKNLKDFQNERDNLLNFYSRLLNQDLESKQAHIVLRGLISLSSEGVLFKNKSKIEHMLNQIQENEIVLPLKTLLALKSERLGKIYLPRILTTLKHDKNLSRDIWFAGTIASSIATKGINSVDRRTKLLISEFLASLKNELDEKNISKYHQNYIYPQTAGILLEATALVNSQSFDEAIEYIIKFMENISENEQRQYVIGFSNSLYMSNGFRNYEFLHHLVDSYHLGRVGSPIK
jgi:hypothetical protein